MEIIKKINSESSLVIQDKHLEMIKEILKNKIPNEKVWAYGSRVTGTAKKHSDLDLVVFGLSLTKLTELKEGFEESNIPFRIDIMDWKKIPESFQKNIQAMYVVLQTGE
ncbi:MAG: nucleotidyltransferase domain-containing protein [Leptospiraceae bacterium]|nr:nucleotidyltransferase domain-containing protein [Leptospiraceae bacterium]